MLRRHEEQAARLLVEMGVAACYRQEDDNTEDYMMDLMLRHRDGKRTAIEVTRYIDGDSAALQSWIASTASSTKGRTRLSWTIALRKSVLSTLGRGAGLDKYKEQLIAAVVDFEREHPEHRSINTQGGLPDEVYSESVTQLRKLHIDYLLGYELEDSEIRFDESVGVYPVDFEEIVEALEACASENEAKLKLAKCSGRYDSIGLFVWVPSRAMKRPGAWSALNSPWTLDYVRRLFHFDCVDAYWIAEGSDPDDVGTPHVAPVRALQATREGWYVWENAGADEGRKPKWRRTRLPMSAELIDDRRMT